jgi:hypothetical protein
MKDIYRDLTLDEVNSDDFEETLETIVEGWFMEEPMGWIDLCDRVDQMCGGYAAPVEEIDGELCRIHRCTPNQQDDPVVKRIIARARKIKRELKS